MPITHSIPSTTRKPGLFHEFDLLSGARGLVPLAARVLGIGVKSSGGTATANEAEQIFDEQQADALFGVGSEAALMARKALEVTRRKGISPEIWMAGIADPAGTAAAFTITVTGTAADAGDIVFRVAGRTLRAGVSSGDSANTVAAAIEDAIDEASEAGILPVTAAVVTNVVTLTAVNTGVNGNDINVTVEDVGLTALTVTPVQSVVGVGVALPATALADSLSRYYLVKVLANHASADITTLDTHQDSAWAPAEKRWNHAMIALTESLSTANTRAAAANSERIDVISYEESPSLPGEIAIAVGTAVALRSLPNYNWDGDELPLFAPPDSFVYTSTEIETALAAGSTPLVPNEARDATQIVRLITTKTLEGGSPFENAKDLATINGLIFTTRQLDAKFAQQFQAVNKSIQVLKRMRSVAYQVLKDLEDLGVTQNVDALFPQLLVETDAVVATRAVVAVPESIIPNLHQIILKHILFVE